MTYITTLILLCVLGMSTAKYVSWNEKMRDMRGSRGGCRERFRGCRLMDGVCDCRVEIACVNPFPYLSKHQCEKDLNGELDKCVQEPCENGQCVQVKTKIGYRSWECSCAGSGFYGKRCDIKCLKLHHQDEIPLNYPTDCIF